jgi:hypothetical protein
MTTLTCHCDPDIRCPELDCRGCECRAGTCSGCTSAGLPRPAAPRPPTERPDPWPCGECRYPMLPSRWLREHRQDRPAHRAHGGHGLCEHCRTRARRRDRAALVEVS